MLLRRFVPLLAALGFVLGSEDPAAAVPATTPPDAEGSPMAASVAGVADPLPAFAESLDVAVVEVEVFVSDRRGEPVGGLAREDFAVIEDGVEVEITNFTERGRPAARAANPATPSAPAPAPPPGPVVGPGATADAPVAFVVYVDNVHLRPLSRNKVFRALRELLDRELRAGDRVMLATYDRSLHVRVPFTTDRARFAAELAKVERTTAEALRSEAERQQILREIRESSSTTVEHLVRRYADEVAQRLELSLRALHDLVGSIAGVDGRKAVLHLSDGLPMRPGADVFEALQDQMPDTRAVLEGTTYDAARKFSALAEHANANRVSFYTVDAAGLRISHALDAEHMSGPSELVERTYLNNHQSPLRYLADATGGQAILNTNNALPGMRRMLADSARHYSLGFRSPRGTGGGYRRLEVRVRRPGVRVRHREGYLPKNAALRMEDGLRAALHLGETSNPLGIALVEEQRARRADGMLELRLAVRIPIGRLALVPVGDAHDAQVRVYVRARDGRGGIGETRDFAVPVRVPAGELAVARGKHWSFVLPLVLRDGEHQVAIGVRDEIADTTAVLVHRVGE